MSTLLDTTRNALNECDELLREIRAENLDGSEPVVGEALERTYVARKALDAAFVTAETIGKPISALLEVSNPHDLDAAPSYVSVRVDNDFIAKLRHLQGLCRAFNLDMVSVNGSPETWHRLDAAEDDRTELDYLTVTTENFFFSAVPKHDDRTFESAWCEIDSLVEQAIACHEPRLVLVDTLKGLTEEELMEELSPGSESPAP
ncbi:hypothetical protein [Pseudoxanthomonas kaohsiungensis]|uniref:Uncharacterized protein n=1 Tax=Pseudoxanthomonas kaohsiungensis TaxID=283923 RepID=A0ABW3M0L1_9GAMM|nr:hypothetical protein [Pseudoxanthomonas kaohsiungensis]KAF1703001.1 hypothetical protein CSC66_09515 [Pseudoxanthomonas kaohsiungensis]